MHAGINVYANSKIILLSQQKHVFMIVLDIAKTLETATKHAINLDIQKEDDVGHHYTKYAAVLIDQYSI